jgi:hypothetical protein
MGRRLSLALWGQYWTSKLAMQVRFPSPALHTLTNLPH